MLLLLLLFILLVMAWMFVAVFMGTAQVLLPWTIAAAVLAVAASLGLVGWAAAAKKQLSPLAGRFAAFALTFVFGYLGCAINPPNVAMMPPRDPQAETLQLLIVPMVRPSQDDIWQLLPLHLAIAGLCAATATALLSPLVEPKPQADSKLGASQPGTAGGNPGAGDAGAGI